jgi:O-antigen/teichoic acid export membrane protein
VTLERPRTGTDAATPTVTRSSGTVGIGLIVFGLSATVYLVFAARAVGPREFGSLSSLWTLIYTFGIGAFFPFEQELGRAVSQRRVKGQGARPVAVLTAQMAGAVLLVLLILLAVISPVLVDRLFSGAWSPLLAFAVAMPAMACQYISRGLFSGNGRFPWYSAQLGLEGVVRMAAVVVLLGLGVHATGPYAWILAFAPLAALFLTLPGLGRGEHSAILPGPPASRREVSSKLGWLLASQICAQAVANAAMVALKLLAPRSDTAGKFLAAFVIARVPLFLFQAVQATLIPALTGALASHDHARFRRELRRVLLATGAVGVAGVAGAALLGPWALKIAFGSGYGLGRVDIVVLAASTGLYMLALVFQSGLVALERHRDNALGWSTALALFVVVCTAPMPALARVELALVLSCALAAGLLGVLLLRSARAPIQGTRT